MGVLESILLLMGRWFGYVGACMVSPDATCRPFLAFVALGAAASVALTLMFLAYRASEQRGSADTDARQSGREPDGADRTRRTTPLQPVVRKPALQTRLHAAA